MNRFEEEKNMKIKSVQFVLFSIIAISSFAQQRIVSGTYVCSSETSIVFYGKHTCKTIKTFVVFDSVKSESCISGSQFRIYESCDEKELQANYNRYYRGCWYYKNNEEIYISLPKHSVGIFSILSDSTIKLEYSGLVFNKEKK